MCPLFVPCKFVKPYAFSEVNSAASIKEIVMQKIESITRIVGIAHRVKQTAGGEARPTMVAIIVGVNIHECALETENDELDFLLGKLPVKWRAITDVEKLESFPKHHRKKRKVRGEEVVMVPETYQGLEKGDRIAMVLGGSGDRFAAALSRRGETVGAHVFRIPPSKLKVEREESGKGKEFDHALLAELYKSAPEQFTLCGPRDRNLIRVSEALSARMESQQARIASGNRFHRRIVGKIFLSEEGHFPEGGIEDVYDAEQASDIILIALEKEERKRNDELEKVLKSLPVYTELLEPIRGVGPRIAAGIIAAIGDIRRFENRDKLRAFAGCHVNGADGEKTPVGTPVGSGGKFPRRTRGKVANWHPSLRQALYLLRDQFNRNPDSPWGKMLLEYKVKFRAKHPEPIKEGNVTRYTNGHIHKMATWRTVTKFLDWLHREWTRLEKQAVEGGNSGTSEAVASKGLTRHDSAESKKAA